MSERHAYLQEMCVIENDLWCGDSEFQNSIVDGSRRIDRSQRLLQIAVEAPESGILVKAFLDWQLQLLLTCHSHRSGQRWCRSGFHNGQCSLKIGMAQFHLNPLAPNRCQIIHILEFGLGQRYSVHDDGGFGNDALVWPS